MLTDFLHLSIGGTLSVGGTGGTMQKVGTQADNVLELQVVTGRGRLVTCSPTRHADLFDAVLAGAGQCGLIVRATVRLVRAESDALVFNLFYDDLDTFLADQVMVMRDGRFSYQEGQIVRTPDDSGWRYMMEVATYFTPPAVPEPSALLAGLSDDRPSATVVEQSYRDWAFRLDPGIEALKVAGFWDQPHAWLTVMVPASTAAAYIGALTAQLTPADLGAGFATLFPIDTTKITRPFFARPAEDVAFQLNLLRFPFPGQPTEGMVAQNRVLYDSAVALDGKRYVIGAIPGMSADDWRRHHGAAWPAFEAAKRRYDPDAVLTPGQGVFG
jgi:FAD/FMN-containing dehydrogenase